MFVDLQHLRPCEAFSLWLEARHVALVRIDYLSEVSRTNRHLEFKVACKLAVDISNFLRGDSSRDTISKSFKRVFQHVLSFAVY